jgi:hypothetical protein
MPTDQSTTGRLIIILKTLEVLLIVLKAEDQKA